MTTRKLYQEMARILEARMNCKNSNNAEWFANHTEYLEKLLEKLPHGNGLDYKWYYDYDKSKTNRIVLFSAFHAMDDGMYDKVIEFTLTITPSLSFNYDLLITGNFGRKYQDIKDYLYDILTESLNQDIDINEG